MMMMMMMEETGVSEDEENGAYLLEQMGSHLAACAELRSYRQVFTQVSLTHGGFILALWLQLGWSTAERNGCSGCGFTVAAIRCASVEFFRNNIGFLKIQSTIWKVRDTQYNEKVVAPLWISSVIDVFFCHTYIFQTIKNAPLKWSFNSLNNNLKPISPMSHFPLNLMVVPPSASAASIKHLW